MSVGRVMTGTEALAAYGFTHRPGRGKREVIDAEGNVVAVLTAREVWGWLRKQARAQARKAKGKPRSRRGS